MPERIRAYRGEELVTIIKGKVGGRGSVTIRNSLGFLEDVKAKELVKLPEGDPKAKLKFGPDETP